MKSIICILSIVVAIVARPAGATGEVPTAGLIALWEAENNANDSAGNHSGTLIRETSFEPGISGQAFSFLWVRDRVDVPHHPNLNLESLPASSYTGWFRSTGRSPTGSASVISKHTCGTPTGWFFHTAQGCFVGDHFVGGHPQPMSLENGVFHHFACVKDGNVYREYIDGVLTGEDVGPAAGTPVSEPVQIGSINTGTCSEREHWLAGAIDSVALYDRALSAAEISGMWDATPAGLRGTTVAVPAVRVPYTSGRYETSATVTVTSSVPVNEGAIRLYLFDDATRAIVGSDATAPVVNGEATFTGLRLAPDGTPPNTFSIRAEYVPEVGSRAFGKGGGRAVFAIEPLLVAVIPLPVRHHLQRGFSFDEAENRLYALVADDFNGSQASILEIDGETHSVSATITLESNGNIGNAVAAAFDGVRRRLYVVDNPVQGGDSRLWIWDAATRAFIDVIPLGE